MSSAKPGYRLNEGIYFAKTVDGRTVVFDSNTGEYYGLDEIGTVFFETIIEEQQFAQILRRLELYFEDAEADQLKKDLRCFLRKLVRVGVLIGR